jgi:hypothetical protein
MSHPNKNTFKFFKLISYRSISQLSRTSMHSTAYGITMVYPNRIIKHGLKCSSIAASRMKRCKGKGNSRCTIISVMTISFLNEDG